MSNNKNCYPHIHFAPEFGWMNDPNGMVYHDGVYEMYYQSNPDSVEWNNMTWSHARSTDLYHWEQLGAVLYPDENGTMFSGSGIINEKGLLGLPEGSLLFPYTAADHKKGFSIRYAYSTDGGNTLEKLPGEILDRVSFDNRDPKILWHEESKAYIIVLWLNGNDFGIFRSEDLVHFTMASRVTLSFGYECPDLVCLPVTDEATGEQLGTKWLFWTADGTYFIGDFDGFTFKPYQTKFRQRAFFSSFPYAAQTFSGLNETVQINWLRTKTVCMQTTGTASLPHVLSIVKRGDLYFLQQKLVPQIVDAIRPIGEISDKDASLVIDKDAAVSFDLIVDGSYSVDFTGADGNVLLNIDHVSGSRNVRFTRGEVTEVIGFSEQQSFNVIWDRGILELHADNGVRYEAIDFANLRTKVLAGVKIVSGDVTVKAGIIE